MIKDLFGNDILTVPFFAWVVAQLFKTLTYLLVEKKISLSRLLGDGGMPSGHSAVVTALTVMTAYRCGVSSAEFAIAGIFTLIVLRDAIGVRQETGKQAKSIKELAHTVNRIFLEKDEQIRTEKLKEFVGHTPLQVFFGLLTGVLVSVFYIAVFN